MKKFLIALVIFCVFVPGSTFASVSKTTNDDKTIQELMQKIEVLNAEISRLKAELSDTNKIDDNQKEDKEDSPRRSKDRTPRVMYWWGKVNQHFDVKSGYWKTDPDGVSGADLNMLEYCQKWYPKTKSVKEYKFETIKNWRNRGNLLNFESRKMSYECSEKSSSKPVNVVTNTTIPSTTDNATTSSSDLKGGKEDDDMQIMYWWGKVNQHMKDGDWETDPDGVSGADKNMLTYCRKWYPGTVSVRENKLVTTDGWKNAGNLGEFTSKKMAYHCVQD